MQEGWECQRCHNVYAPNTPFCLYCWFQQYNINQTIIKDQHNNIITNENKENIAPEIQANTITSTINTPIVENKHQDLSLDHVDIAMPVLNKQPIIPLKDTWPNTKIYLGAMGGSKERAINRKFIIPYILDSIMDMPVVPSKLVRAYFDYIEKNNIKYMLDSGAFSYLNNPKKNIKLTDLLDKYCLYINEFNIEHFFELDLDIFLPLEDIENIRRKIYLETHKKPIIVYHETRGIEYWDKMCKENDFVAIGGIVTSKKGGNLDYQQYLCDLCDKAHSYGTQVHGLGFTPLSLLNSRTMFFDTVDSTSWNIAKKGQSWGLDSNNNIIPITMRNTFTTTESQEEDIKIWANFASNYFGGKRNV